MFEKQVGDVTPVFVGNPVRPTLELEQVIVPGAVLGGQLGRLAREDRVVIAPDVQHGDSDPGGVGPLGAQRPVPVEGAGRTDLAERRDIAVRMRWAETGRGQQ